MAVVGIIYFAVLILLIVSGWKIYEKAGEPGWASIVPIYNIIVFLKIVGKPLWWIVLFLIPIVSIVFAIWSVNLLSIKFGKGVGFTIGLILLPFIFFPILAFGDAKFQGATTNNVDLID